MLSKPYLTLTVLIILTGLFIWIGVNSPNVKPVRIDTLVVIQNQIHADKRWKGSCDCEPMIRYTRGSIGPSELFKDGKTSDTMYETKVIYDK